MNARQEAYNRLQGAYEVRVLEPSPPPVTEPPWFADDPVAREDAPAGVTVVSPVSTGDLTWDELCHDDPSLAGWCAERWLGAYRRLRPIDDVDAFATTRAAWHMLAEHVVAPARHAANGRIGLRFTRRGFGTPWFAGSRPRQVRIDGTRIVRDDLDEPAELPLTNVAAAAEFASIEPGAPRDVYEPTTRLDHEGMLTIDPAAAALLGDWFGFAASVLEEQRAGTAAADAPSRVQLWPEHFDLSFDFGDESTGSRGTYGASPGDTLHPEPYLYVTHWSDVPPHRFWNDRHFDGASLSLSALVAAGDQRQTALAFFDTGRGVLRGASS